MTNNDKKNKSRNSITPAAEAKEAALENSLNPSVIIEDKVFGSWQRCNQKIKHLTMS